MLKRRSRAPGSVAARPSNDFERPMAAEHGAAVISSAKHGLCGVFEWRIPSLNPFRFSNRAEDLLYNARPLFELHRGCGTGIRLLSAIIDISLFFYVFRGPKKNPDRAHQIQKVIFWISSKIVSFSNLFPRPKKSEELLPRHQQYSKKQTDFHEKSICARLPCEDGDFDIADFEKSNQKS